MAGMYIVIARGNLIKKLVGLNVFQASVFVLYISFGNVSGGTAPILVKGVTAYSNPLPHVLILTAIVVGVATTALGQAPWSRRQLQSRLGSGCLLYTSPSPRD